MCRKQAKNKVGTGSVVLWEVRVRYHTGGSMKLNTRILHLAHMVYLLPKHNSLLARQTHNWHDMYKVGTISEVHGTVPLVNPLCLEKSLPYSWSPLTYLESLLCVWCDSCPPWSQVACVLTFPPFFLPIPLFPFPNGSPVLNTCPPTATSQRRLHIVRYSPLCIVSWSTE